MEAAGGGAGGRAELWRDDCRWIMSSRRREDCRQIPSSRRGERGRSPSGEERGTSARAERREGQLTLCLALPCSPSFPCPHFGVGPPPSCRWISWSRFLCCCSPTGGLKLGSRATASWRRSSPPSPHHLSKATSSLLIPAPRLQGGGRSPQLHVPPLPFWSLDLDLWGRESRGRGDSATAREGGGRGTEGEEESWEGQQHYG
jgi:hypothetical protein